MPRPQKVRQICSMPLVTRFGPMGGQHGRGDPITLTLDEYECIRLIDHEGKSQEECAAQMGVARTTVQAVYNTARQKMAAFLVDGKNLVIRGGCYRLCNHDNFCGRPCRRREKGELPPCVRDGDGTCPREKECCGVRACLEETEKDK